MNSSPNPWKQLAAAATPTKSEGSAAPYGFATRTVAQWKEARRNETFRLWERWSLRAGAASLALCGIIALGGVIFPSSGDATLIPIPSIDLSIS